MPIKRHGLAQDRGDGGAGDAEFRRAEIAEDQGVVSKAVRKRRSQRHEQHDARARQGGKVAFQHHHEQARQHPEPRDAQIGLGIPGKLGRLAEREQQRSRNQSTGMTQAK